MAVIGNFRLSRLYLTGSDDQENAGPTSVNLSRQVHTVARAGHLNVGEKQPHVVAGFQQLQRGVGVLGFDDAKTMVLKQTGSVQAQKLIVFDYEDHWLRLAHKTRTHQRAPMFLPTGAIVGQSWPQESGQFDKWIFCLTTARLAEDQEIR